MVPAVPGRPHSRGGSVRWVTYWAAGIGLNGGRGNWFNILPREYETFRLLVDRGRRAKWWGRRAKWWRRRGSTARGFRYEAFDGSRIVEEPALGRIRSLVVPPAWSHVRICPLVVGKVQAIGIDGSGRLQYIYHPKFVERQQKIKFARIERFGRYMAELRQVTNEHIALEGFPLEKVLAMMTRLINSLYIRMGTDKSVKQFRTYGITTLSRRHVSIAPKGRVVFEFVGKSHIKHKKVLVDPDFAALLNELLAQGKRGKLFQYVNGDQKFRPVQPSQINAYIKSITAPEFTAKDFRTWGATYLAAVQLAEIGASNDASVVQKNIVTVIKRVAEELGNTPAVCRLSYIHPCVLKAYAAGLTLPAFTPQRSKRAKRTEAAFEPGEMELLEMFERFR
ncbi:DNA topoisomerase IB [soil metagenome]